MIVENDLRIVEWIEQQADFKKAFGLKHVDCFGGAPKAPEVPDPAVTAAANAAANKETATAQSFLNNVNQTNPFGSIEFQGFKDPETGLQRFRSDTTLNPTGQAAFDAEQDVQLGTNRLAAGQIERIGEAVKDPFTFEGLPAAPTAGLEGRQRAEDVKFGSLSRRLNTRFDRDEDLLRGRLATQGITGGSEAFSNSLQDFNFAKNDAFEGAAAQAVAAGGAEQSRLFGLQGSERERAIQERQFLRQLPLNEATALLRSGGDIGIPQFGGPAQTAIAPTDFLGAQALSSSIAQQNYQSQLESSSALNSGLFGLGGSALGAGATYFGLAAF
ncbi:MAG: hypothetical protein IID17_12200 [Nitrospinae bacterium]|nr:hypothetical protein [Nitrospinota bacterium]